jgi:hypothetical protein
MRIRLQEIKLTAKRVWTENGKRRQETKAFMQTINPFNKNDDGTVKTGEEILKELHVERKAWLARHAA